VVDGQLRFVLARGSGQAFETSDVPKDQVLKLLEEQLANR
jgi:3-dehydroquinate synthase